MKGFRASSQPTNALVVVAKHPSPGFTKTRLVPPLSYAQAAELFKCMLMDTLDLIRQVPDVHPVIAYFPAESRRYFTEIAPDFEPVLQQGSGLGERLDHALTGCFQRGYTRAVIMNSDGPTLPEKNLEAAFLMLGAEDDIVLGPSEDGGYYLIGMRRPNPCLFRAVRWSTSYTAGDTIRNARENGLTVKLLPTWYDVDDRSDLERLTRELAQAREGTAAHTSQFLLEAERLPR